MGQSAFGVLLQKLREMRGLSLRELMQLADIDHAYIYRLETGDKESPSEEVVTKLSRALKAGKRETDMLRYLAQHAESDPELVTYVLGEPTVSYELFQSAAAVAHRGAARPAPAKLIERIRRILAEEESDG